MRTVYKKMNNHRDNICVIQFETKEEFESFCEEFGALCQPDCDDTPGDIEVKNAFRKLLDLIIKRCDDKCACDDVALSAHIYAHELCEYITASLIFLAVQHGYIEIISKRYCLHDKLLHLAQRDIDNFRALIEAYETDAASKVRNSEMIWNVYHYNMNVRKIETFNIFRHGRFRADVEKSLAECSDKETFADRLNRDLQYYFWSKYEYELFLVPWSHEKNEDEVKIDIYKQVRLNWDVFVDYVWSYKAK